jgi:trk system potassium uptake protein TrkH
LVVLPVSVLVVIGGLGFTVIYELMLWTYRTVVCREQCVGLSIHTWVVLKFTGLLLLLGMLAVWWGWQNVDAGLDHRLSVSFFQSVTTRTAGFNTVPLAGLAPWCLVVFMLFMFIGAAPGGTAGGIKISTLALLYYSYKSLLRGRKQIEVMQRTIPVTGVQTAFVLCGLAIAYVAFAVIALIWAEPQLPFFDVLFEVVSAFGTVGLSMGATQELSTMGKMIIIITMYVGRVGPLTVFLAMVRRRDESLYQYPTGTITVG